MATTLIGFYRKDNRILSLYSDTPTFFDTTLNDTIIPTIVPLSLLNTTSRWTFVSEHLTLPTHLQNVLHSQSIFMTTTKESSDYYILMYIPQKTPTMSRGGILLQKTETGYNPVIVLKHDIPYIIDIKGSGSPVGGFPDAHFRVQAGSLTGFHLRVTGGLAPEGARKEYQNLLNIEKTAEKLSMPQHINALGIHQFDYQFSTSLHPFAQLLRLTPSSIRFSFKGNPVLDDLNSDDESIGIYAAGVEASKLLHHTPPLLHRNCSWNNLVYIGPNDYALTDYEEADHAHIAHCNLELINAFYPLYFNNKYYQDTYFSIYKKGLLHEKSPLKSLINHHNPTSIAELNKVVMSHIIHPYIFEKRQTTLIDTTFITDTLSYMKSFLPQSYYTTDLLTWADTKLRNYLNIKKALLTYYNSIRNDHGFSTLLALWETTHTNARLQSEFETHINRIEPHIRKLIAHAKYYTQKEVGQYKSEFHLITLFYTVPQREEWLDHYLVSIDHVLTGLDSFIQTQTLVLPSTFVTDNIEERREHLFDNIISFVCPYIPFLMVHFDNEKNLLTSIRKTNNTEKVNRSLEQIEERLAYCANQPGTIHHHIRTNSKYLEELFILDYMQH